MKYMVVVHVSECHSMGGYQAIENHIVEGNPLDWFGDYKAKEDRHNAYTGYGKTVNILNWLEVPGEGAK